MSIAVTDMRGKLVTKPSTASETLQPPPTPPGSQFGAESPFQSRRRSQALRCSGHRHGREEPPKTLLTCSCQNWRAEVACDVTGIDQTKRNCSAR